MFKNVFKALSKGFHAKEAPAKPQAAPAKKPDEAKGSVLNKISGTKQAPASAAKTSPAAKAAPPPAKPPEEICGVTAKMSKDEIKSRLALLYRRYNRATSSLDAKLRGEAEIMLDAVVVVREKHFGPI